MGIRVSERVKGHIEKFFRVFFKAVPYCAVIVFGALLYHLSYFFEGSFHNLLVNVSSALFVVPTLFFCYEVVQVLSHKQLNREILDYLKKQVDRELLSILNQVWKMIYKIEEQHFSFQMINEMILLTKEDIVDEIKNRKYLGFQILKTWGESIKGLNNLLQNPFILEKVKDDQIISILKILDSLEKIELLQTDEKLYIQTRSNDGRVDLYKLVHGTEMNSRNTEFPDRFLLLKRLGDNKYIVTDFGDISKGNVENSLRYFLVNEKMLDVYSGLIFNLIDSIDSWARLTDSEFIVDHKMFQVRNYK